MKGLVILSLLFLAMGSPEFQSRLRSYKAPSVQQLLEATTGLLQAIGVESRMDQIVVCIRDFEGMRTKMTSAVSQISQHTAEDVEAGIKALALSLEQLPQAMISCDGAVVKDARTLESMLHSFEKPVSFEYIPGEKLEVNGVDILASITSAESNWNGKHWQEFGKSIGEAMKSVSLATLTTSLDEVVDIISGVLNGIGQQLNATAITSCISDVDQVYTDMEQAVEEIKQWTWDSVKTGISDLASALEVVPTAMTNCAGGAGEAAKMLEQMLYNFKHPISYFFQIQKHLMVDGVEILEDISSAVAAWDKKAYFNFGTSTGKALALVFGKDNQVELPSSSEVLDIIGGLLVGIGQGIGLSDIEDCIKDTETTAVNLYDAVKLFEEKTPADVKQAIHDLGEALEFIPGAIENCASAFKNDARKIAAMLKVFESPLSFIYNVGKNLILNGNEIYSQMVTAISAWKSQKYYTFGDYLGQALAEAFLLPTPTH